MQIQLPPFTFILGKLLLNVEEGNKQKSESLSSQKVSLTQLNSYSAANVKHNLNGEQRKKVGSKKNCNSLIQVALNKPNIK